MLLLPFFLFGLMIDDSSRQIMEPQKEAPLVIVYLCVCHYERGTCVKESTSMFACVARQTHKRGNRRCGVSVLDYWESNRDPTVPEIGKV